MAHYRIVEWSTYQHYRDRAPPWIKLHANTLTSRTWVSLSNDSRTLAIACMLVAADTDNEIPVDPQYMRRRAYFDAVPDFAPLVDVPRYAWCYATLTSTENADKSSFSLPSFAVGSTVDKDGPGRAGNADTDPDHTLAMEAERHG